MAHDVKVVTDQDFGQAIAEGWFLVDFFAEWCGPCKMMEPVIHEFASKHLSKVRVVQIDIDSSPETTQTYSITSVPTLILFQDGEPAATFVGLKDLPQLEQLVFSAMKE